MESHRRNEGQAVVPGIYFTGVRQQSEVFFSFPPQILLPDLMTSSLPQQAWAAARL
jgi:hypothetical protein